MSRLARIFVSAPDLARRVDELAEAIAADGPADLLLVTVLKGGVPFLADLVRRLEPRLGAGVTVDFLSLSSYAEGEHPPGAARILKDLDLPVTGSHVIVVEDVVHTGLSLAFLLRNLSAREPASLRTCALLDREAKRLVDLPLTYRGFTIADDYVVGYGLDFFGLYRNLPCLVAVHDFEALRADPLALVPLLEEWGIWSAKVGGAC